jgi:hypothetical protein
MKLARLDHAHGGAQRVALEADALHFTVEIVVVGEQGGLLKWMVRKRLAVSPAGFPLVTVSG